MTLYTIFDRVAQRHLPPFLAPNDETAKRSVRSGVNGGDNNLTHHHHDYDLYAVALFDESTGLVTGLSPVVHVCTATSLKAPNDAR